ncbi:MAG: histidine phosphatase family protein [Candidatus Eremiobacteraeota bacterium]|nr:histidine phosphatase family protein [Candidatus Eremiobacteraeota bacterium]
MIFLARHAETTWNLEGRYQGRRESPLSGLGVRQGAALAEYFYGRLLRGDSIPARVISSPLSRCVATADFTGSRLSLPVETDPLLIEIAHGTWEGRLRDELAANDSERYRAWREDPSLVAFDGGEKLGDVIARWQAFEPVLHAMAGKDVLVVTHDAVIRVALLAASGRDLTEFWHANVENAAYALLASDGERLSVLEECVTSHLTGVRAATAGQAL